MMVGFTVNAIGAVNQVTYDAAQNQSNSSRRSMSGGSGSFGSRNT